MPEKIKPNSEVPEQNILDLRQIMAERQSAAEVKAQRGWRLKRAPGRAVKPVQPRRSDIVWPSVKRESLKFGLAILAVLIPTGLIFGSWRVSQAVRAATATTTAGFSQVHHGLTDLSAFRVPDARQDFHRAELSFARANSQVSALAGGHPALLRHLPLIGKKYRTAEQVVSLGQHVAAAGRTLSTILPLDQAPIPPVTISSKGLIEGSIGVLKPLAADPTALRLAVNELIDAVNESNQIDARQLPAAQAEALATWQRFSSVLLGSPNHLKDLTEVLWSLLAPTESKEYIVIFENNDELRATGGFTGTFLLVKFDRGSFTILDAPGSGPYDLTSQTPHTSLPPQPILSIAPYWTFHDANWFLDVPTSASFTLDFYEQARGFRPDGIIYLTPGVMEDFLKITGPLRPDGYGVDITADNFVRATEQQVEFGFDKALNNPKQFLIDLVPVLLKKMSSFSAVDGLRAMTSFLQRANQADALFYSQDLPTETAITHLGWDGAIQKPSGDYLAVVDSNLGGGKTDRVMTETVTATITPRHDRWLHTIAVTRSHQGKVGDPLTGAVNRDFIRVYAPSEAEFIDVSGATVPPLGMFLTPESGAQVSVKLDAAEGRVLLDQKQGVRLSHESGKNVFGAWSIIGPGQQQTVTFTYTTPIPPVTKPVDYTLFWQKQPGAPRRQWQVRFELPARAKLISTLPFQSKKAGPIVTLNADSAITRNFRIVYQP